MNNIPVYLSKQEVLNKALEANGKRISDFNVYNRSLSKNNKGVIGQIIEEGLFGYSINSKSEADFINLSLELKVTGLKKIKKNNYVAKERLVLNIIDYVKENNIKFEASSFWKKNASLLLMFYLYEENSIDFNFLIINSVIHDFPEEDLEIIKKDWNYITNKIKIGEAHHLSEGDTMYLGACTKGANSNSYRTQPFSSEKARQRAFCLKNSYLNQIIRRNFINEKCKSILTVEEVRNRSFEAAMDFKLSKYIGKSEADFKKIFNININSKNKFERYIALMLGINGRINKTDEFLKANIKLKTIRIQEKGNIKESMSFPAFKFTDLVNENWMESEIREYFVNSKFMFAIFKEKSGIYYFEKIKFWNMSLELIDMEIQKIWSQTVKILNQGNIVKSFTTDKSGRINRYTNFPKSTENRVMHVRPHGRDSSDTFKLPIIDKLTGEKEYTKQCFWLNSSFIKKIINEI